MNQKLNKRLHALLSKQGLMEQKAELVSNTTNGRVTSSSNMTDEEVLILINSLESVAKAPYKKVATQIQEMKQYNTLRKCFALFRKMDYYKADKPDYDRIDGFCKARSSAKKKLTDMTNKELSNLIYQLEKIINKNGTSN